MDEVAPSPRHNRLHVRTKEDQSVYDPEQNNIINKGIGELPDPSNSIATEQEVLAIPMDHTLSNGLSHASMNYLLPHHSSVLRSLPCSPSYPQQYHPSHNHVVHNRESASTLYDISEAPKEPETSSLLSVPEYDDGCDGSGDDDDERGNNRSLLQKNQTKDSPEHVEVSMRMGSRELSQGISKEIGRGVGGGIQPYHKSLSSQTTPLNHSYFLQYVIPAIILVAVCICVIWHFTTDPDVAVFPYMGLGSGGSSSITQEAYWGNTGHSKHVNENSFGQHSSSHNDNHSHLLKKPEPRLSSSIFHQTTKSVKIGDYKVGRRFIPLPTQPIPPSASFPHRPSNLNHSLTWTGVLRYNAHVITNDYFYLIIASILLCFFTLFSIKPSIIIVDSHEQKRD